MLRSREIAALGDGFSGLARITADSPLAIVASNARIDDYQGGIYDTNDSFGFPAYTTKSKRLYIPLLEKRRDNYLSGINIVNLGDEPTNVTATFYSETSGVAMYEGNGTIGPNGKMSLSTEAFPIENGIRFSGVIRSSKSPIAAYVYSDTNLYTGTDGGLRAFGTTGQPAWSKKLFIPAVYRNANGYVTTIAIQNAGIDPTTISIDYYDGISATMVKSITSPVIQPNAAWYLVTDNDEIAPPAGFNGYAIATRSGRHPGYPGHLPQNRTCAVHIRLFGMTGYYPRHRPDHDLAGPNASVSCTGARLAAQDALNRSCSDTSPRSAKYALRSPRSTAGLCESAHIDLRPPQTPLHAVLRVTPRR